MTLETLPAWAAIPAALLLILGGLCTAIGSLGLARLGTFFQRMHGPSMGNTLGTGCVLFASILVSSTLANRLVMHEILITVFIVPETTICPESVVSVHVWTTVPAS